MLDGQAGGSASCSDRAGFGPTRVAPEGATGYVQARRPFTDFLGEWALVNKLMDHIYADSPRQGASGPPQARPRPGARSGPGKCWTGADVHVANGLRRG